MAEVLEWDVIDGGILGALIRCPDCPTCLPPSAVEGSGGTGCEGDGKLFRPYRLHGREIDLHRDAEALIALLDRKQPTPGDEPGKEQT